MKLISLGLLCLCLFLASIEVIHAENDIDKTEEAWNQQEYIPEDEESMKQEETSAKDAEEEDEQLPNSENKLNERSDESQSSEVGLRYYGCRWCQKYLRACRTRNSWLSVKNRRLRRVIRKLKQILSHKTSLIYVLKLKIRRLIKQCNGKFQG